MSSFEGIKSYPQVDNRFLWYNSVVNMKRRKTLIITILIIGGLVCFGGIFLAKGIDFPYSFSTLLNSEEFTAEDLEEIYGADIPELERLIGQIDKDGNLTEAFLDKLTGSQGELLANGINEDQIEMLVEEFIQGVDMDYSPNIYEADFNISSETSKEAVEEYLILAFFVIDRGLSQIRNIDQFVEEVTSGDERKLNERIRDFERICSDLKDLAVPLPALEVHKTSLEMFQALTDLLKELKFLEKDPLRTLLAASKIQLIGQRSEDLARQLQDLINKYSITLL